MPKFIKNISSLVTCKVEGKRAKYGLEMQDINEIKDGALVFDEKILFVGESKSACEFIAENNIKIDLEISGEGKTVLPSFVDSHTHIVFGGNRSQEFAKRLRGYTYQQIAEEGGGILTTVLGTRKASIEELVETGKKLALSALRYGTTAMEIKSGYGLTVEDELKMLYAIRELKKQVPLRIYATFLGAHDFPPEYKDDKDKYVDIICNEMLPRVAEEGLAEFCDAFIDKGYYTLAQGEKILRTALDYGFKLKVHCDELADYGSAKLAGELGAISADHLLFVSDDGINALKKAGTIATLLPGTAYFIKMPFAPARKLIESGIAVALSTDCNPGSCFTENMQLILSFATINMNMTAEEAISSATINSASALDKSHLFGSLEVGKFADFIIADTSSYIDIFYHFGVNHIESVWIGGVKY